MSSEHVFKGHTLYIPAKDENVAWTRVGEVFVMFGKTGPATEARMDRAFDTMQGEGVEVIIGAAMGSLGLTSVQRKRLSDSAKDKTSIAILDANPLTRGVVTALGWFGLKIHLVGWDKLDNLDDYADLRSISPGDLGDLIRMLRDLSMGEGAAGG